MPNPIDDIQFNADGLVPVIAIDSKTGKLLMQAWANREAVQATMDEGHAVYWSRSRGRLWRKGESSGHVQKIEALYLDCDGDSLCYEVEQLGGIACHTGRESCYYRKLEGQQWRDVLPVQKPSSEIYGEK